MTNNYQYDFVSFLIRADALTFGQFVTKSGRHTPYFVNTGRFNDGAKISELGRFYATHIHSLMGSDLDIIFGPAYKGIPLAVAAATALYRDFGISVGYAFDRKEVKDHGDGGRTVGAELASGKRIVLVEDVITAGTTLRAIVPLLRGYGDVIIKGVIVAVDRCERGSGTLSAVMEAQAELGVSVMPIVTVHTIREFIATERPASIPDHAALVARIDAYLEQYGASK